MGTDDKTVKPAGQGGVASQAKALVKALRPGQWIRNGLVFFPLVFSVQVAWSLNNLDPVPGLAVRLLVLFAAFCALSSAVYLFNDLADREADRQHPVKRLRPIASGKVRVPTALTILAVLAAAGLAAMVLVEQVLGAIGLLYLAINAAYSLGVKRIVMLDVLAVASGYLIRAVAGAVAIGVTPSPWLYVTTGTGALFIVLGRRYAEARLAGESAAGQRPVLSKYAGAFIGQCITISAAAAWLSYTLYTVEAKNLPENNTMLLTLPMVTFGLFRYLYLLNTSRKAEAPEQMILRDAPLVLSILCWMGVSALVLLLN
jgi:4-hydroxybenzoate polyprenyltransferase